MAMAYSSVSSNSRALLGSRLAALAGEAGDLRPALDEAVVGERLGRALLALAEGVEAVGQLAGDLGLGAELGDELRRRAFAAASSTRIRWWTISQAVRRGSVAGSQSAGSSSGRSSRTLPRFDSRMPASTMPATLVFLALESCLGHAVLALGEARLLEPGQRPAAVGVEVALLLGQRLVEGLVDERQRLAHGERLALGVEHLGVAGVDRHARADGRLRQVHRRDVAALQVGERHGQLGLERGDELAARGGGRIGGARAADEDDAGGEGVGVRCRSCGCPAPSASARCR